MKVRIESLILIVWLGMHFTIGYVVAPLLFSNLGKMTAGDIAGQGFTIVSWIGIVATILLLITSLTSENYFRSVKFISLFLALILLLVNQFVITPVIVALKTNTYDWLLSSVGGGFSMWHGISSIIYLLTLILGVIFTLNWSKVINS